MGFGQVASLVAFTTVIYAIFLSYQDFLLKEKDRAMEEKENTAHGAGDSSHELRALTATHSYSTDLVKVNEDDDSVYQEVIPPPVTTPPVRQPRRATTKRKGKDMEMAFVAL